jgi:hypothetical protein
MVNIWAYKDCHRLKVIDDLGHTHVGFNVAMLDASEYADGEDEIDEDADEKYYPCLPGDELSLRVVEGIFAGKYLGLKASDILLIESLD